MLMIVQFVLTHGDRIINKLLNTNSDLNFVCRKAPQLEPEEEENLNRTKKKEKKWKKKYECSRST